MGTPMTRDYWCEPSSEPRPGYRDASDHTDRADRLDFDWAAEADHARKLRAIREAENR
jgi:hypothetical protein